MLFRGTPLYTSRRSASLQSLIFFTQSHIVQNSCLPISRPVVMCKIFFTEFKTLILFFVQGFLSTLCYGTGFVVTLPGLLALPRIRGIPTGTLVLCNIPVVLPTMSFSLFTTSTLWRVGCEERVSVNPSPSFFVMDFGDSFPQNRHFFQSLRI
jgi:hypothetical protein